MRSELVLMIDILYDFISKPEENCSTVYIGPWGVLSSSTVVSSGLNFRVCAGLVCSTSLLENSKGSGDLSCGSSALRRFLAVLRC